MKIFYRKKTKDFPTQAFKYLLMDNEKIFSTYRYFLFDRIPEELPEVSFPIEIVEHPTLQDVKDFLLDLIERRNYKFIFIDGPNKVGKTTLISEIVSSSDRFYSPVRENRSDPLRRDPVFFSSSIECFFRIYEYYTSDKIFLVDRFFVSQLAYHSMNLIEEDEKCLKRAFNIKDSLFIVLLPKNYIELNPDKFLLYEKYALIAKRYPEILLVDFYYL